MHLPQHNASQGGEDHQHTYAHDRPVVLYLEASAGLSGGALAGATPFNIEDWLPTNRRVGGSKALNPHRPATVIIAASQPANVADGR